MQFFARRVISRGMSNAARLESETLKYGTPVPEFSTAVKAGYKAWLSDDSSFSKFKLVQQVELAVSKSGILVPSSAQIYGIPRLLAGENLLLISQTGKGKTLAYLLPMVDKLLRTNEDQVYPKPNRPRAIVIVPTRELAVQALAVVRKMFGSTITSIGLAPGILSFVKEKRILASAGADLIITTPSRLQLHLTNHNGLSLSDVQTLVFDEADTLCDSAYEKEARSLVAKVTRHGCQVAIVGATRTAGVSSFIASIPGLNISPVVTADAHIIVPHLDQVFVPVGRRKRTSCLTEILSEQRVPNSKTLVFTNSVRTCNFVSRFLREQEYGALGFHGQIPYRARSSNYKKFADPNSGCDILVCTNLASRGIDLDSVNHVIMYDFPHTLADYIHRAGRTARAGRLGKVTALFTKRNMALAKQIQDSMRDGRPIEYRKAIVSVKRAVRLDKYQSALDEMKFKKKGNKSIRGLRAMMGLPPHLGIGSPQRREVAKDWKRVESGKRKLKFLQKRRRLGKKEGLPKLPDRGIEATETSSISKLKRNNKTGDLQFMSMKRDLARN